MQLRGTNLLHKREISPTSERIITRYDEIWALKGPRYKAQTKHSTAPL